MIWSWATLRSLFSAPRAMAAPPATASSFEFWKVNKSGETMNSAYYFLTLSSATAAVGQILLKLGASRGGWEILKAPQFWGGGFCYFISFVLWVYALSKVELGMAYPFTALTFVMVFLLSFLVLGESVSRMELLGIMLILSGFLVMFKAGQGAA
ncbi:hypothetical protein C4J81_03140 [Deltaproteobacteria bacterium Smac51]|nr:hypothetical protein C4J81_03140 [Deltaproteobacteria bacterium Smac51]